MRRTISTVVVVLLALGAAIGASITIAAAQGDARPIRLLVGFPPGGSTDILARTIAQDARRALGQEIVIVNKPGASGALAATEVATAPPDGLTIGLSPSSSLTLAPHFQNVRVDLLESTDALIVAGRQRIGLVTRSDSRVRSLADLIAAARGAPGKVSIGTPGVGAIVDLLIRALFQQAGVEVSVVPFQGDGPIVAAVLGGHVDAGALAAGGWSPQVQSGAMRLLIAMDAERAEVAPDVPTLIDLGHPFRGTAIQYMFGPKGLPGAIRARLIEAFLAASRTPAYVDVARRNSLHGPSDLTGEALDRYLLEDRAGVAAMVAKLGLKRN